MCRFKATPSIYIPHIRSLQSTMWLKHWYAYISNYCHMPLSKYTCHIAHLYPTACWLYFTSRPKSTTHTYNYTQNAILSAIYVPATNMSQKCHIHVTCPNYSMFIDEGRLLMHQLTSINYILSKPTMAMMMMQPDHWPTLPKTLAHMTAYRHIDSNYQFYTLWFDKAKSTNNPKNCPFKKYHILLKWKFKKFRPFMSTTSSLSENYPKSVLLTLPALHRVQILQT